MKFFIWIFLLIGISQTWADSINVETFHMGQSYTYMSVEDPLSRYSLIPTDYSYILTAHASYADDPLVESNASHTARTAVLVHRMTSLFLGGAYRLRPGLLMGVSSFLSNVDSSNQKGTALGDTRLFAKWRFLSVDKLKFTMGLMPELILPTGSSSHFTSDDSLGMRLRVMAEIIVPLFGKEIQLAVNGGYHSSQGATFRNINYRNRLFSSVGVYVPFSQSFGLNAEMQSSVVFPTTQISGPGEFYAGMRAQLNKQWAFQGGVSTGGIEDVKSVDYRVLAALKYIPPRMREYVGETIEISESIKVFLVNFDYDKWNLSHTATTSLDQLARYILDNEKDINRIRIEGHTDKFGSNNYNNKLSLKRAYSVREYLMAKNVAPQEKWMPIGFGKYQLKFFSGNDYNYKNRRVEIHIEFKPTTVKKSK